MRKTALAAIIGIGLMQNPAKAEGEPQISYEKGKFDKVTVTETADNFKLVYSFKVEYYLGEGSKTCELTVEDAQSTVHFEDKNCDNKLESFSIADRTYAYIPLFEGLFKKAETLYSRIVEKYKLQDRAKNASNNIYNELETKLKPVLEETK